MFVARALASSLAYPTRCLHSLLSGRSTLVKLFPNRNMGFDLLAIDPPRNAGLGSGRLALCPRARSGVCSVSNMRRAKLAHFIPRKEVPRVFCFFGVLFHSFASFNENRASWTGY